MVGMRLGSVDPKFMARKPQGFRKAKGRHRSSGAPAQGFARERKQLGL